jgi:hypothetical protein
MMKQRHIVVLLAGLFASGSVFASGPGVPELDAGGVPVVMGLTIALVVLIKERHKS